MMAMARLPLPSVVDALPPAPFKAMQPGGTSKVPLPSSPSRNDLDHFSTSVDIGASSQHEHCEGDPVINETDVLPHKLEQSWNYEAPMAANESLAGLGRSDSSTSLASSKSSGTTDGKRKVFICSFPGCGKEFQLKGNLKRHENIHIGTKKFKCKFCGRGFLRKADMEVHYRVHTGGKPYKCRHEGCGKSFARRSDLLSHERTHTGDKPYRCEFPGCAKRFARKFDLHKHQRMHDRSLVEGRKKRKNAEPKNFKSCSKPPVTRNCTAIQGAQRVVCAEHGPECTLSPLPLHRPHQTREDQEALESAVQTLLDCDLDHDHISTCFREVFPSLDSIKSLDRVAEAHVECPDASAHRFFGTSEPFSSPQFSGTYNSIAQGTIDSAGKAFNNTIDQQQVGRMPWAQDQLNRTFGTSMFPHADVNNLDENGRLSTSVGALRISKPQPTGCPAPSPELHNYWAHNPSCGHLSIQHGNHFDYVVNNHLVCQTSVRNIGHSKPEAKCKPDNSHRPGCGHLPVRHRDHIDYVVEDNLLCQQAGLLEDADEIELLDDDFWDFYGAVGSMSNESG